MIEVVERPRVGVLNTSLFYQDPKHEAQLKEFADVSRLKLPSDADHNLLVPALNNLDAIIASVTPNFSRETLEGLPKLCIISRTGIGFSNIDTQAATDLGIQVSIVTGDVERNSVAEIAIGLLISAARYIPQGTQYVREGLFAEGKKASYGPEISGKTVGIIGLGNIGSRSAEILSRGFGCKVLAYDPMVGNDRCESFGATRSSLTDLLRRSDFVLLHCPSTPDTRLIIGPRQLATMKKGAILINTARGDLVDSRAVISALDDKHLRVYATDVYPIEPILKTDPFANRPDVIAIPHLGGNSEESVAGISDNCVGSVRSVLLKDESPVRLANPEVLDGYVRMLAR